MLIKMNYPNIGKHLVSLTLHSLLYGFRHHHILTPPFSKSLVV